MKPKIFKKYNMWVVSIPDWGVQYNCISWVGALEVLTRYYKEV